MWDNFLLYLEEENVYQAYENANNSTNHLLNDKGKYNLLLLHNSCSLYQEIWILDVCWTVTEQVFSTENLAVLKLFASKRTRGQIPTPSKLTENPFFVFWGSQITIFNFFRENTNLLNSKKFREVLERTENYCSWKQRWDLCDIPDVLDH